jgi:hypothetical protein
MPIDSAETPVFIDLTDGKELVINTMVTAGYFGSQHVIVLGTSRAGVSADGKIQSQCALVARLRFDNGMAHILRDALNNSINASLFLPMLRRTDTILFS